MAQAQVQYQQEQSQPGQYKISKWLYRPYQVLFFDSEDLAIGFFFFLIAFIFGGIFWLIAPVALYFIYKEKAKRGRGFIKHLLYRAGFYNFKGCPSVFEKKFRE